MSDAFAPQGVSGGEAGQRQFLSFRIGEDDYAIDILSVREIKGWARTTPLPNQPDHILGVMNLRGAIVPVHDIRCRFGGGMTDITPKHVVIIAAVSDRLVGLLVDQVSDILSPALSQIGPVPETASHATQPYLAGIVTVEDHMVVLLELDQLFNSPLQIDAAA